jgi:hypothetical protein
MRAENIATVTVTTDGRLTYQPTEKFLALGMTEVDLGADTPEARREVVSLNFQARQRNRQAKDAKVLARADAIRAKQAATFDHAIEG